MALSFPLTMPAGLQSVQWRPLGNVLKHRSPISKIGQNVERAGFLWAATFTIKPLKRIVGAAPAWTAFLTALEARGGTFFGFDPAATTPLGTGNGTPLVNGASQTGHALVTDGWAFSETVLREGDYMEVNARFYKVSEDAASDGAGNATLEIDPPLRESPANNAALTVTSPKVTMELDGRVGWSEDAAQFYGFAFSAIERL